jgi:hypothetical protein
MTRFIIPLAISALVAIWLGEALTKAVAQAAYDSVAAPVACGRPAW